MKPLRLAILFGLLLHGLSADELLRFDFNEIPGSLSGGHLIQPARVAANVSAQAIARPSTVYMYRAGRARDYAVQIALPPDKYTPDHSLRRAVENGTFFEVSLAPRPGQKMSLQALTVDLATSEGGTGRRTVWLAQRVSGNQTLPLGVASTDSSLGGDSLGASSASTVFDLSKVAAFQETTAAVTLRVYVMLEDGASRLTIDNLGLIGALSASKPEPETVPLATYRFDDLPDPIPTGAATAPVVADGLSASPIARPSTLVWWREVTSGGYAARMRPVDDKLVARSDQYYQRVISEGTFFSVALEPAKGALVSIESIEFDVAAHPEDGLCSIWLVERTAEGNRAVAGPFTYEPGGASNSFFTSYSKLAIRLANEASLQKRGDKIELRIYLTGETKGSQIRFDGLRVNGSVDSPAGAASAPPPPRKVVSPPDASPAPNDLGNA